MLNRFLKTVLIVGAALLSMGSAQASELPTPTPTRADFKTATIPARPVAPDAIETPKVVSAVYYEQGSQNGSQSFENQQNGRNPLISADFSIGGGYALPYGNCVDEPGVKRQGGNPSSWRVRTQTPYPGATFLMWSNHTGIVVGRHGNMLVVRHRNWQGGQFVFPISAFRGFI